LALVASASMLLGATRCAAYRSVAFSLAGLYVASHCSSPPRFSPHDHARISR
jgi:hypothetical protein